MVRRRASWICALAIAAWAWLPTRALASPAAEVEGPAPETAQPPPPVMVPPPPEPMEVDPRNYRMVLAGDVLIGLSGGGMIAMAIGLGIRSDARTQRQALTVADQLDPDAIADAIAKQDQRLTTGTLLAITGAVAAAALLSSGITLVALGHRRERLRRMNLPEARLIPSIGPRHISLTWQF